MECGLDPWEMLAGAGTCLDQSHGVARRWIGSNYNSKQMGFNFFFHVCDRPYRVITVIARLTNAKTVGRAITHTLTLLDDEINQSLFFLRMEFM